MSDFETCIVGAGFAGAATACYLADEESRGIVLIEQERAAGLHASGHNASLLRCSVPDRAIGLVTARSVRLIRSLAKRMRPAPCFSACGSLLLVSPDDEKILENILRVAKETHQEVHSLSKSEAVGRFPVLREASFARGLFCPEDGVIDINSLLSAFLEEARDGGVTVLTGTCLKDVTWEGGKYRLEIEGTEGQRTIRCKRIVNAAGAWSNSVAGLAGLKSKPLRPCRRHLFFGPRPDVVEAGWPYVWDLSHAFYFRPHAEDELLLSPCDEEECTPVKGTLKVEEEAGRGLHAKLERYMPFLSEFPFQRSSAELRTLSPDGRFIIGPDPDDPNFFWVSGLGGHGVTASAGVGEFAAHLLLGKPVDRQLAAWFSPSRF